MVTGFEVEKVVEEVVQIETLPAPDNIIPGEVEPE
jgi:hypothetical protein